MPKKKQEGQEDPKDELKESPESSTVPDADTVGDEDDQEGLEAEPEEKSLPPWGKVRDDLYRRQSQLEDTVNRAVFELKQAIEGIRPKDGGSRDSLPPPSQDPMVERLKLQQNPRAFIGEEVERRFQNERERMLQEVRQSEEENGAKRRLLEEFPEFGDRAHPFFAQIERTYAEVLGESGEKPTYRQALTAARIAAREHPELRDKSLRERRRETAAVTARERVADNGRPEFGSKPVKKSPVKDTLPELSQEDQALAKRWKINLDDPKVAERIRKYKAEDEARRLPTREELVREEG